MRLILIAALTLLLLVVLIAPLFRKKRRRPSFLVATLILIPIAGLGWMEYTWVKGVEQLESSFQKMTQEPNAKFSCARSSGEWFNAFTSETAVDTGKRGDVQLKHSACGPLLRYQAMENKEEMPITNSFTEAVIAYSIAGVTMVNPSNTPAKNRCVAIMKLPQVISTLGGSPRQAYLINDHYQKKMKNAKLTTRDC